MINNKNWTNLSEDAFSLDKAKKKSYIDNNKTNANPNAFDDETVANSALDYLYSDDNSNKTQNFLKNNGFPSSQERELNKELYGIQEERNHMLNLLKSKTNSILTPNLPNDTDRAFLKGLMGDKEGEQDYQNQLAATRHAQKDLKNAFQDTQFELVLKSGMSTKKASDETRRVNAGNLDTVNDIKYDSFSKFKNEYDETTYFNNKIAYVNTKSDEYNNKIKANAKMNDKSVSKVKKSSDIIANNAESIKMSANKYGVNPSIIAACIYTEQVLNYNALDLITDKISFINPSAGIGQVCVETAKIIEQNTNIEKIQHIGKTEEWHGNNCVSRDVWYVPGYGTFTGTKEQAILKRLNNDAQCIEYVAAYLKLIQDIWRDTYPIIDGKTDILASLYNVGEYGGGKGVNSNPEPNDFGIFAKKNYYHMQYLLGI